MPKETSQTLFEKIGGQEAVDIAVDIFYGKLLNDDHVGHYFGDVDMDRQYQKMKSFLAMALGGPRYSSAEIRKVHARLGKLNDKHFNIVVKHLRTTLEDFNIAPDVIDEIMAITESVRDDVLNRN